MNRPRDLRRRLQTLRSLPARARLDLVRAQSALVRALLMVRFRKRGSLLASSGDRPENEAPPSERDLARARELAVAVRRVAEHGPLRAPCLARALATCTLLEREGLTGGAVRVGVQMTGGTLTAHAWVEFAGTKLIESESEVENLAEVDELTVRLGA